MIWHGSVILSNHAALATGTHDQAAREPDAGIDHRHAHATAGHARPLELICAGFHHIVGLKATAGNSYHRVFEHTQAALGLQRSKLLRGELRATAANERQATHPTAANGFNRALHGRHTGALQDIAGTRRSRRLEDCHWHSRQPRWSAVEHGSSGPRVGDWL